MWRRSSAGAAAFTRPADTTAYASNDLVANSTTAGSVTPLVFDAPDGTSWSQFVAARIEMSDKTTTNAAFDLHLFEISPTVANGDNGAFSIAAAGAAVGWLGKVSVTVNGLAGATTGKTGIAAATAIPGSAKARIYGLLVATAAYTPASAEVFTVTLYNFG